MRLIKNMYGNEFHPESELFGIHCGQIRSDDTVHNGGWYNLKGEKIGWGDLSPMDMLQIAVDLEPGEAFIVIPESASFWNFVTHNPGIVGSCCETAPDIENPGIEYVLENSMWLITSCHIYRVLSSYDHAKPGPSTPEMERYYGPHELISRDQARKLVLAMLD
jgi:hypothetical protein